MALEGTPVAAKPKPWWQIQPQRQVSTARPAKGAYAGSCARVECDCEPAYWFNATNGKYYCSACARRFNDVSTRHGEEPLCELRL